MYGLTLLLHQSQHCAFTETPSATLNVSATPNVFALTLNVLFTSNVSLFASDKTASVSSLSKKCCKCCAGNVGLEYESQVSKDTSRDPDQSLSITVRHLMVQSLLLI